MMDTTPRMKKIYGEIQKKLFYMIPEKWDKIYLYASVEEGLNNMQTGEMYFYYFPKGILKKDPVNVYEIPAKFNIDETGYFKLADQLYGIIKKLRKEYINVNEKRWTTIIISVENFKFKVEYGFESLKDAQYNSYDRHIIFRYMYLNTSINTYNKKERKVIDSYIRNSYIKKEKKETYVEPIYKIEQNNIIDYQRENQDPLEKSKNDNEPVNYNYEIKNNYEKNAKKRALKKHKTKSEIEKIKQEIKVDKEVKKQVESVIEKKDKKSKNQILNFDEWD